MDEQLEQSTSTDSKPLADGDAAEQRRERPQDNRVTVTTNESVGVVILGILSLLLLAALLRAQARIEALMQQMMPAQT
jgi:hypothetical protein